MFPPNSIKLQLLPSLLGKIERRVTITLTDAEGNGVNVRVDVVPKPVAGELMNPCMSLTTEIMGFLHSRDKVNPAPEAKEIQNEKDS